MSSRSEPADVEAEEQVKDDEAVGSLADEAAKLFGAVSQSLGDHLEAESECEWCPVCRTVRAVRDLSPEVKAHLVVAGSALAQAAAGLLATAVPDPADNPDTGERADPEAGRAGH